MLQGELCSGVRGGNGGWVGGFLTAPLMNKRGENPQKSLTAHNQCCDKMCTRGRQTLVSVCDTAFVVCFFWMIHVQLVICHVLLCVNVF